jgi:hypothetical protein
MAAMRDRYIERENPFINKVDGYQRAIKQVECVGFVTVWGRGGILNGFLACSSI